MPRARTQRLIALALLSPSAWAAAQATDDAAPPSRYVLGADLSAAPQYSGSNRRAFKLRPIWAYQYGRFRISSPGAGGVLGFGDGPDERGPGASTELLATDRWKAGIALRFDGGRSSSDSSDLSGMPDVRRTLRGRFYASHTLSDHWNVGATLSQDLLGRQGGATAAMDLGYHDRLDANTTWSASAGIGFADSRYMKSYYGVTERDAAKTGLRVYSPGAGVRDVHLGIGIMTALSQRWILFGGAGWSRLQGDAAASPLTTSASTNSIHVGLAYRCCK